MGFMEEFSGRLLLVREESEGLVGRKKIALAVLIGFLAKFFGLDQ